MGDVGKRMSGGSFESGPSSMVRGGHRTVVRRGQSSSFGQGSARGTRLQEYHGKSNQRTNARISKLSIPGVKTAVNDVRLGVAMGRDVRPGTLIPAGASLRPGARVGSAIGSAIATPGRAAATTAGVVGGGLAARKISKMEPLFTPTNLLSRQAAAGKLVPQLNPVRSATPTAQAPTGRPATGTKAGGAGGQKAAGQPVANMGTTSSVGAMAGPKASSGTHSVTKAARSYDQEAGRQRRLGNAQAVTGVGGAGALVLAAREQRSAHRSSKVVPRTARSGSKAAAAVGHQAGKVAVSVRGAKLAGAGLAGLAASHRISRYSNNPSNRRWS